MDTNLNVSKNNSSDVQFPTNILSVIAYIGIIGAVLSVLPLVITSDDDFLNDIISTIGDKMTSIAEIVFISLISYKIYKDGIAKPSYSLLACFAGVIALDFIGTLISDEVGVITFIIYIIGAVVAGVIFLMAQDTKKIGLWFLLSIVGSIILFAIVSNDEFKNTQKYIAIVLAAIYCYPYTKFLESCQTFLIGDVKD